MPLYATRTLGVDTGEAFYILSIMNAVSIFGRVIPGFLGDILGAHNVLIPCTVMTAVLAFSWISVRSVAGLIVFAAFYGFFSGALVSLPATVTAALSPDFSKVGTRMGMCFSFAGFGLLVGSPVGGAIINVPEGEFLGAQTFGGATIMVGAILWITVRCLRMRDQTTWKL